MIGTRLGPYEITGKLGEGGMGEVYRATDSKLKREVAIKVLPAAFTDDKERLARFEREAQLLAQLHHPNIASIFGLEEGDRTAGGVRALVMELVDGEDLSARIARGPMSLEEAIPIARQIAEALEAAHEQGIVHRDLKPQNIKVRADGTVKVLDFGLAKAMDAGSGASSQADVARSPTLMNSPTLTAVDGTQLGVILGTAAYMAPEQARGGTVDKRVDIWAFGVVLYEMLVGRTLFASETVTDTLAGVLKTEIDFGKLPAATPSALRTLLRRTLARSPKQRLHDIADARLALEELERGVVEEGPPSVVAPVDAARRGGFALALGVAAALALGLAAGWLLRRPAPEGFGARARWALAVPDGMSLQIDQMPQLAISEDGRVQVAVVLDGEGTSHLLLRSSDELAPRILADTEGASGPFFSPDGAWIGYFRNASLVKLPVAGGPPVQLTAVGLPGQYRGATWSRDGYVYFAPNVNVGLSRISEEGGEVTPVTKVDVAKDERTHRWPQALPDGSAVLFTNDTFASTEFYDDASIDVVKIATGERHRLIQGASQARYISGPRGGHLIFARGGSLYSQPFDPGTLQVRGTPQLAVQGVATDVSSGAVQFAMSESGAAIWAPGALNSQFQLYLVDRKGGEAKVSIPPAPYNEAELSPDGKRVALIGGDGGAADLWVADLDRGTQSRLTIGESVINPVWTPDGSRIAFVVRVADGAGRRWRIAWKPADGSREQETLVERTHGLTPGGFTPDGRALVFSMVKENPPSADLFVLPLEGTREPKLLLASPFNQREARVSPDGRWMAYTSNEAGGGGNVFVRPFPAGEGRWQISVAGGNEPRWSADQHELFFRSGFGVYGVTIDTRSGITAGKPVMLVDRVSTAGGIHTYAPLPDGRIFTPRSPTGRGAARTVDLDLAFARRLVSGPREREAEK
ncbi:MAG: protein kinase [Acidobacteriota bacterium]